LTPRTRQLALTIDRDRRRLELIGVRAAHRIGTQARTLAYAAWRTTRDVHAVRNAVTNVLRGNARLGLTGITPLIRDGMVTAHLEGRRRTAILAAPELRKGLKLSVSAFDEALRFLIRRLMLTPAQLEALRAGFQAEALRVTDVLTGQIEKAVESVLIEQISEGASVPEGVTALRRTFESEGFVPAADHTLEAVFRTQTQTAYSAGRWNALQDPAIQDILWGFEYAAITDDRVTEDICLPLNGMVRTKDDPVWQRLTPPNHWNALASGTLIRTQAGEVPIEWVQPGDQVFTHRGRFRRVYAAMEKRAKPIIRELHLSTGRRLRITDEHPVLTSCGWQPAGNLNAGDVLFEHIEKVAGSGHVLLSHPENFPSLIDEPLIPWDVVRLTGATTVPLAVDLYDGHETGKGEVDNERPDGVLEGELCATANQQVAKQCFVGGGLLTPSVSLADRRSLTNSCVTHRVRPLHSFRRIRPGLSVAPVANPLMLRQNFGESASDFHLIGLAANGNAEPLARRRQGGLSKPERAFDGAERFSPSQMTVGDEVGQDLLVSEMWRHATIIRIVEVPSTTKVHNLAVEDDETYLAEGVIVHNCRSTILELYDERPITPVPNVTPQRGFGFNPGNVFRDTIRPAAA